MARSIDVSYEIDGRVAVITLDRAKYRNAQSRALLEQLDSAFDRAIADQGLRWRDLPKPTIASVQGYCIFGGWMIASAMDLVVAADDAKFLPTHFQYFSVPWDLGPRKTKELLWTADFIGAEQACELGLVSQVVARSELDSSTLELAHKIASKDRLTARMIKKSVNEMQDLMGFRTAVTTAWSSYMLLQEANQQSEADIAAGRRHPGVTATMGERSDSAS